MPPVDLWAFENGCRGRGFVRPAGVDEAGRGPLAGPVVAAAVVLPERADLPGVNDSKLLTAAQRDRCYEMIINSGFDVGVGCVEAPEIDQINILRASLKAMKMAIENLRYAPDFLLIDGIHTVDLALPQEPLKKGDRRSISVAAASIVAKVHRDRLMLQYHERYPEYGFASHKGYGTRVHLEALCRFGPCPIHRMTFRGVAAKDDGNGNGRSGR